MLFKDKAHEEFFEKYGARYVQDRERRAFFYLMGVSDTTRNNINKIYDFEDKCIIPTALNEGFQTSSSKALTRLAFDLYHGNPVIMDDLTADETETELYYYSVSNIFSRLNEWIPYAIEAIKIRYQ